MPAPRASCLPAVDFSPTALERARTRLRRCRHHVQLLRRSLPEVMRRAAGATGAELLVFLDADTVGFEPGIVTGLLGPVLLDPTVDMVKGTFRRPLRLGDERRTGAPPRPALRSRPSVPAPKTRPRPNSGGRLLHRRHSSSPAFIPGRLGDGHRQPGPWPRRRRPPQRPASYVRTAGSAPNYPSPNPSVTART
jgi:hypothetical protein